MGGRKPFGVLPSILVSEQPQINIAPPDLLQIKLIRPSIPGRNILKEEDIEKTPKQGITLKIIPECRPLPGELLLDSADEDAKRGHKEIDSFRYGNPDLLDLSMAKIIAGIFRSSGPIIRDFIAPQCFL
jgi:hypothetical protein